MTPQATASFSAPAESEVSSDDPTAVAIGQTLGRYEIVGRVGQGGMGLVYEARDPVLERDVAIKVVWPGKSERKTERAMHRLRREASLLARLNHPNIVQVYDVGFAAGRVWIAMELVRGDTLGEWVEEEPRDLASVLSTAVAAGRGLAAAHEAGLSHRDFKPSNVLVGDDGRTRVLDFGLAEVTGTESPDAPLYGTVAYLAPEAFDGQDTGPLRDQYAFCVALYEVLYGCRPFEGGADETAVLDNKRRDAVTRPADDAPLRPFAAIRRGLRADPRRRFPSMDALLAALTRRRRGHVWAAAAAAGVVGIAMVALGSSKGQCAASSRFDADAHDRIAAAFSATGLPYADEAWPEVEGRLERHDHALADALVEACRSGDPARLRCAYGHGRRFDALVDVLAAADAATVSASVSAVAGLTPPSDCTSEAATPVEPGPTMAVLARAKALEDVARYDEAIAVASEAVNMTWAEAEHALRARALLRLGSAQRHRGHLEGAHATLVEAQWRATAAGDDATAASAATQLIHLSGDLPERREEADMWIGHAEAAVERQGHPPLATAELQLAIAGFHADGRATEKAERAALAAIATFESVGADATAALEVLGNIRFHAGRHAEAIEAHRRVLQIRQQRLDEGNPAVAVAHHNLGTALGRLPNQYEEEAVEHLQAAIRIARASLGDQHVRVARSLVNLASMQPDDLEAARANLEEAVGILSSQRDGSDPELGAATMNLGNVELQLGDAEAATRRHAAALATFESTLGESDPRTAVATVNLGRALVAGGETTQAREQLQLGASRLRGAGFEEAAADAYRILAQLEADGDDLRASRRWLEQALALTRDPEQRAAIERHLADVANRLR